MKWGGEYNGHPSPELKPNPGLGVKTSTRRLFLEVGRPPRGFFGIVHARKMKLPRAGDSLDSPLERWPHHSGQSKRSSVPFADPTSCWPAEGAPGQAGTLNPCLCSVTVIPPTVRCRRQGVPSRSPIPPPRCICDSACFFFLFCFPLLDVARPGSCYFPRGDQNRGGTLSRSQGPNLFPPGSKVLALGSSGHLGHESLSEKTASSRDGVSARFLFAPPNLRALNESTGRWQDPWRGCTGETPRPGFWPLRRSLKKFLGTRSGKQDPSRHLNLRRPDAPAPFSPQTPPPPQMCNSLQSQLLRWAALEASVMILFCFI